MSIPNDRAVACFDELGERVAFVLLKGWCGPLVPESPTPEHDHRKRTLTWTDCSSKATTEGYVLTYTMSTWSYGRELIHQSAVPRGVEPIETGRSVLSWKMAWSWIREAGLDLDREEVRARVARVVRQAICPYLEDRGLHLVGSPTGWRLEISSSPLALAEWRSDGTVAAGSLPPLALPSQATIGQVWRALLLALRPQVEGLVAEEVWDVLHL